MKKEVSRQNGVTNGGTEPLNQTLHPIFSRQGTRVYRRITGVERVAGAEGFEPATHGFGVPYKVGLGE